MKPDKRSHDKTPEADGLRVSTRLLPGEEPGRTLEARAAGTGEAPSAVMRRDLAAHYALMQRARERARARLEENEWRLLLVLLRNTLEEMAVARAIALFPSEVAARLDEMGKDAEAINREQLLEKVGRLDEAERLALLEAAHYRED